MNSYSFKTIFGWITVKSLNSKLISVKFNKTKNLKKDEYLIHISNQIKLYSLGKLKKFDLEYSLLGTPLQIKIWNELSKIKYGQTKSYGEIANRIKTSPRYVGSVCGQNNLLLIIPCHRVIKTDGSLGGFSSLGGIKLKKKLLKIEAND